MNSQSKAYALRLPASIKAEVERVAKTEGTSINQFIATAVAEKLATMRAADYFQTRRQRADFDAFDAIMARNNGEAIKAEDRF